jgi:hypothetical protein
MKLSDAMTTPFRYTREERLREGKKKLSSQSSRSTYQLVQESNRIEGSEDEAGSDSDFGLFVGNAS